MAKAKSRHGRGAKIGPIDAHVGARLRQRRSLLLMTQTKLGDALGVSFQQMQKYERGTNRISASRLFDLLRVPRANVSPTTAQYWPTPARSQRRPLGPMAPP